jgi:hypothetical protein
VVLRPPLANGVVYIGKEIANNKLYIFSPDGR